MSRTNNALFSMSLCAVVLFASCSDYYSPVREYFERYTNGVEFVSQSVSVPTEPDRDGIATVPSATDIVVTFHLWNPRCHVIVPDYQQFYGEELSGWSITLSPDQQSIVLTFPQDILSTVEGTSHSADFTGRVFFMFDGVEHAWDLSLRCDTPPPRPEGACVVLYDNGTTTTYVLCFNLDLSNLVHEGDIPSITINGTAYATTVVHAGSYQYIGFTDTRLSVDPPGTLTPISGYPDFVEDTGCLQVYYSTGIAYSGAPPAFTITVRNTMGLSRTAP